MIKKAFKLYNQQIYVIIFYLIITNLLNFNNNSLCFVINSMLHGGAERVTQILSTQLALIGYQVLLITGHIQQGEYRISKSVNRHITDIQNFNKRKFQMTLIYQNVKPKIYIFQEHWNVDNQKMINEVNRLGGRTIAIHHSFFMYDQYINLKQSLHNMYKNVDVLCCLSNVDVQLFNLIGLKQAFYMPNPMTIQQNDQIKSDLQSLTIIQVARMNQQIKRQHLSILAMQQVVKQLPNAKLVFVGDFPSYQWHYYYYCKQLINKTGLQNNIYFTGLIQDEILLQQQYLKASVFILTSIVEGFPMSLLEAKAYGLPNIVMNMSYLELTKQGSIIVGKNDVNGLAKEIIKLLQNVTYRQQMGLEAFNSAKIYQSHIVALKWHELIQNIYKGSQFIQNIINSQQKCSQQQAYEIAQIEHLEAKKHDIGYNRTIREVFQQ